MESTPPVVESQKKPGLNRVKLFVPNNDDAKFTLDLFSVLSSCEIYPGYIFTLLVTKKYLIVSRFNIKRTGQDE